MVIETSALVAIYLEEPEADAFLDAIASSTTRLLSSISLVEVTFVLESRKGWPAGMGIDQLLLRHRLEVVAFLPEHAEVAREAWRRYGKGNHPARLNLGDCCSYALAKLTGEPLLFQGAGFYKTDITPVIPAS